MSLVSLLVRLLSIMTRRSDRLVQVSHRGEIRSMLMMRRMRRLLMLGLVLVVLLLLVRMSYLHEDQFWVLGIPDVL